MSGQSRTENECRAQNKLQKKCHFYITHNDYKNQLLLLKHLQIASFLNYVY